MTAISDLDIFARVARTGNMSAAGREMGLSPAVISKRVSLLEERLGARLFQRTTRQLTLTETGSNRSLAADYADFQAVDGAKGRLGGRCVHGIGFARSGHLLGLENPGEFPAMGALYLPQVKRGLEIQPVAWIDLEEQAEARGGVGRDGTPAGKNFTQAALRNTGRLGGSQLGDAERLEEFVPQDEAGVGQGGGFAHVWCPQQCVHSLWFGIGWQCLTLYQ